MSYTDHHLRFVDQAEADAVLFDGERALYDAIDVVGVIWSPTGGTIETGEGPVPELAPVPGWHVNVRHVGPAPALAPFAITVLNPKQVWA